MALLPEQRDIEAELTFLLAEQGGRQYPVFSGYRPQFYFDGHDFAVDHDFGDVERVRPGQTVIAYLLFAAANHLVGKLHSGTEFQLREGAHVVAHGRVLRVLHLEENARQATAQEQHNKGI